MRRDSRTELVETDQVLYFLFIVQMLNIEFMKIICNYMYLKVCYIHSHKLIIFDHAQIQEIVQILS